MAAGARSRLFSRLRTDRGTQGKRRGTPEADFVDLIIATHRPLAVPVIVVWAT